MESKADHKSITARRFTSFVVAHSSLLRCVGGRIARDEVPLRHFQARNCRSPQTGSAIWFLLPEPQEKRI